MAHVKVFHEIDPATVAGLPGDPGALARGFARFVQASWLGSLAAVQQSHEVTVAVNVRPPESAAQGVGKPLSVTVDYLASPSEAEALADTARQALAPEAQLLGAFRNLSEAERQRLAEAPETDAWRMPAHPRDNERL